VTDHEQDPAGEPKLPDPAFTDVAALRASSLAKFRASAADFFAKNAEMHSLVLAVSQFFADEAGDAVHELVYAFPTPEPWWPHRCDSETGPADGSRCGSCDYQRVPRGALDENTDGVLAWSAFCTEWGGGEGDPSLADPVAIARRAADGTGVEVELVHEVVRPWLDSNRVGESRDADFWREAARAPAPEPVRPAWSSQERALLDAVYANPRDDGPRRVLVDLWLEQGDVRGEFGALSFAPPASLEARARRAALEAAHGRRWLGPLQPLVPVGGVSFARGPFPARVLLSLGHGDELDPLEDWAVVDALRFANEHHSFASTMTGLTELTGLSERGLFALKGSALRAPLRTLGLVSVPRPEAWSPVLSGVRALRLERAEGELSGLTRLPGWGALETIEVWFALEGEGAPAWTDARAARALKTLGPKLPPGASLAVGYLFANGARGGVVAVQRAGTTEVVLEARRFAGAEARANAEARLGGLPLGPPSGEPAPLSERAVTPVHTAKPGGALRRFLARFGL
jgi:hypothetical protein